MPEQIVITDTATELLEVARQGPPGGPGPAGSPGGALLQATAGAALSGHMAVAYDDAGELVYASADTAEHAFTLAGITTGAAASGAPATVQRNDVLDHAGWAFVPGMAVFLGLNGMLVQAPDPSGVFLKPIGVALTATRLMLSIQPAMFLA